MKRASLSHRLPEVAFPGPRAATATSTGGIKFSKNKLGLRNSHTDASVQKAAMM